MRSTNIVYCFAIAISLLLAGCATTAQNGVSEDTPQRMSASALYAAGKEAMNLSDYPNAIRHFNSLTTQYPVDKFALQGRLELAYAYHKSGQNSSTIATTERFIAEHPQHKNIDYAYYLRGLTAYEAAIAELDQDITGGATAPPYQAQMALEYLTELNNRFPQGKYSADATLRMNQLNERIAQYLVLSAKQQLDLGNHARAALLAKAVVEEYPESGSIQEAAIVTNQAYQLLGLSGDNSNQHTMTQMEAVSRSRSEPPIPVVTPVPSGKMSSTTHSTTESNLMPASSEIRDTAWVMSQSPDRYTIQVLGTENEVLLRHQIKSGGLTGKVAYYKKLRDGAAWYSLIYGIFENRAAAQSAARSLPAQLRQSQPWIRKMGDIQASLN